MPQIINLLLFPPIFVSLMLFISWMRGYKTLMQFPAIVLKAQVPYYYCCYFNNPFSLFLLWDMASEAARATKTAV